MNFLEIEHLKQRVLIAEKEVPHHLSNQLAPEINQTKQFIKDIFFHEEDVCNKRNELGHDIFNSNYLSGLSATYLIAAIPSYMADMISVYYVIPPFVVITCVAMEYLFFIPRAKRSILFDEQWISNRINLMKNKLDEIEDRLLMEEAATS
jgi:hypothetical protein